MNPSSLSTVLSFKNIRDLNIAKAELTKEELTNVLDNANVSRLFLDGIQTLDLDMMKNYFARNKELVCFSVQGCPIPEMEVIKSFLALGHEKLQVLILPSGRSQLFSGEHTWDATVYTHKFPNGSRVEIKLTAKDQVRHLKVICELYQSMFYLP